VSRSLRSRWYHLTLMTLKPSASSSYAMSSAGVLPGRCRTTAFIGFMDLGWSVQKGNFFYSSWFLMTWWSAISLVITLVPFLVLRSSKLHLAMALISPWNFSRFICVVILFQYTRTSKSRAGTPAMFFFFATLFSMALVYEKQLNQIGMFQIVACVTRHRSCPSVCLSRCKSSITIIMPWYNNVEQFDAETAPVTLFISYPDPQVWKHVG